MFRYLQRSILPTFSDLPNKRLDYTSVDWLTLYNGTIMPLGPAVEKLNLSYWYDPNEVRLYYEVSEIKLTAEGEDILAKVPKKYIFHRSRDPAISATPLLYNERVRRFQNSEELRPRIEQLQPSEQVLSDIFRNTMDTMHSMITYNADVVYSYVNEHWKSSAGSDGVQSFYWYNAQFSSSEWQELVSLQKQGVEEYRNHEGMYCTNDWMWGMRSRSNPIVLGPHETSKDRDRLINFGPFTSQMTVGMPNKQEMYAKIMAPVYELSSNKVTWWFPPRDRTKVYSIVSERLQQGYTFLAYDASTWDASVPSMLGKPYRGLFMWLDKLQQGSGSSLTTANDSTAVAIGLRDFPVEADVVNLGDDITILVEPSKANLVKDYMQKKGFAELQPEDTENRFILGLYFANPAKPAIMGLKATKDAADAKIKISFGMDPVNLEKPMVNLLTMEEKKVWHDSWFGEINGKPILSYYEKITDWFSPSVMQSMITENAVEELRRKGGVED